MTIVRFELAGQKNKEALETDIALALFAAECVYGKPRVRLEASYLVADDGQVCVVRADGDAGDAAARIFAGLTAVRVGEKADGVRRMVGDQNDN